MVDEDVFKLDNLKGDEDIFKVLNIFLCKKILHYPIQKIFKMLS